MTKTLRAKPTVSVFVSCSEGLFSSLGAWTSTVALVEAVNASRSVNQLLLAGEKRVASGADFNVQVAFFGGACLKSFAAGAGNGYLGISWMYLWFHCSLTLTIGSQMPHFPNKP